MDEVEKQEIRPTVSASHETNRHGDSEIVDIRGVRRRAGTVY
jgi:hypothetical protein